MRIGEQGDTYAVLVGRAACNCQQQEGAKGDRSEEYHKSS